MTASQASSAQVSISRTGIVWFGRDLRLHDHLPLLAAARDCARVCPVYVTSTWWRDHDWTGPNRQQFLCGCLAALDADLRRTGGRLLVRQGPPVSAIERLLRETGADELHFQRDTDPQARQHEREVEALCDRLGVKVRAWDDLALHAPDRMLTESGGPYRVFTPFWRKWAALPATGMEPAPPRLALPEGISSDPLPTLATWGLEPSGAEILPAGESFARQRLRQALGKMEHYEQGRNTPELDATSRISQDLRFGLLSVRTVVAETKEAMAQATPPTKAGMEAFLRQLAWRDFFHAILHHVPETLADGFAPQWRGLPWDGNDDALAAWQQGRTGFPIVDAAMRELLATGHMHNRTRMTTAMFLTKDLRHHWVSGESWFMRHLVDGDTASNNGGWQWCAGTGADAAPYFRIQNPWLQSERHDPRGTYIKRWVPELAAVHPARFHQPPENGRPLADGYPLPIVDHKHERILTLAMFKQHAARASK